MSVTHKALHLPPFISTSWAHVVSLHMEQEDHESLLVVTLTNGAQICIPSLEDSLVRRIFRVHAEVIEQTARAPSTGASLSSTAPPDMLLHPLTEKVLAGDQQPSSHGDSAGPMTLPASQASILDDLPLHPEALAELEGHLLEHQPILADHPPLPTLLLQRMALMGRFLHPSLVAQLPRAESGCSCPFCQIHRVLHGEPPDTALSPGEEVLPEELQFRSWEVKALGDHQVEVSNPEDPTESYQVFLGDPLGCTCGQPKCEHLRAALQAD